MGRGVWNKSFNVYRRSIVFSWRVSGKCLACHTFPFLPYPLTSFLIKPNEGRSCSAIDVPNSRNTMECQGWDGVLRAQGWQCSDNAELLDVAGVGSQWLPAGSGEAAVPFILVNMWGSEDVAKEMVICPGLLIFPLPSLSCPHRS